MGQRLKYRSKVTGQNVEFDWDKPEKPSPEQLRQIFADQAPKQRNTVDRIWDAANTPMASINDQPLSGTGGRTMRDLGREYSQPGLNDSPWSARLKGFVGGSAEALGDTISSLSSPFSLAMGGLTAGTETAASMGFGRTSAALGNAERATSAGMGAHGAYKMYEGDTLADKAGGALEFAGGLAGYRSGTNRVRGAQGQRPQPSAGPRPVSAPVAPEIPTPENGRSFTLPSREMAPPEHGSYMSGRYGIDQRDWLAGDPQYSSVPNRLRPPAPTETYFDSMLPASIRERVGTGAQMPTVSPVGEPPPTVKGGQVPRKPRTVSPRNQPQTAAPPPAEAAPTSRDVSPVIDETPAAAGYDPNRPYARIDDKAVKSLAEAGDTAAMQELDMRKPKLMQELGSVGGRPQPKVRTPEIVPEGQGFGEMSPFEKMQKEGQFSGDRSTGHFEEGPGGLSSISPGEWNKLGIGAGDVEPINPNLTDPRNNTGTMGFGTKKVSINEATKNVPVSPLRRFLDSEKGAVTIPPIDKGKLKEGAINLANAPRTMMASVDLSAPLRQGAVFVGKKEFWKALPDMFKAAGSERGFQALQQEIAVRPSFPAMKKSGLFLADLMGDMSKREEAFMSDLPQRIPGLGAIIKGSNRGYTGFLNKLRADVFDSMISHAETSGAMHDKLPKEIATFINNATGRGDLGKLEQSAKALSTVFFSPRLIASRVNLLNPVTYAHMDPFVRKEAIKSMLQFAAAGNTMLGLAKLGGADVELDPRSSDFGKMKFGDTRFDPWGGFQQFMRVGAQLISGQSKSPISGQVKDLGSSPVVPTRKDVAVRFAESKLAPIPSFIDAWLNQHDSDGQPVNMSKEAIKRVTPLLMQDLYEVAKSNPALLPPAAVAGTFGMGVQTFSRTAPRSRARKARPSRYSRRPTS